MTEFVPENGAVASSSSGLCVELEKFDDGHSPGGTKVATQIARYRNRHSSAYVSVFDDLLSPIWADRVYSYAVERSRPWGVYIPTAMAKDPTVLTEELWANGEHEKALSLEAVRALFFDRGAAVLGPDLQSIHGTAVWCLTSSTNSEVRYHLDYAELYRYETNIIYPPLYAGTYQASRVQSEEDMKGGDFFTNVQGLEHYARFGYKGRLASEQEFEEDLRTSKAWMTIPYRFNRGTFCDGNLPHLASRIESIKDGMKRVILGFNAFPVEVSECCQRAPEHSDAFNRTIKIYQALAAAGLPITTSAVAEAEGTKKKGMNAKDILKNPVLAKMLVTAARIEKARQSGQVDCGKPASVSKPKSSAVGNDPYGSSY